MFGYHTDVKAWMVMLLSVGILLMSADDGRSQETIENTTGNIEIDGWQYYIGLAFRF